ncbi:hypothetical protein AKJ56_02410 [candidate division MSBL1 archaeon SCGC-AAA382N08]|uniref:M23ase beta-sheet core domain-containing protein n=1 Tax=candidate division MSBL1 archaeon SCGC-AAA382N08 TaxID=1698285 RepID=A0A133VMT4_9EURY|nr:hypothetical protein AKJ56_02410 [candidate division MSBL1 archaeon SCGC-AAA382N08]
MPDLKENQKYNNSFEQLTKTAYDLAGSLPETEELTSRSTARQNIEGNELNNVRNVSRQSQPQQKTKADVSTPSQLGTVTVPYGGRTKFEPYHPGVDVAMETGEEIPAFAGGEVTDIRTGMEQTPRSPSFGNYVTITDKQGNKHRYSHLHNAWVNEGQEISAGDIIGGAGHTGGAYSTTGGSGTHLDYRIKNAYDKYMNPSKYLGEYDKMFTS